MEVQDNREVALGREEKNDTYLPYYCQITAG